MVQQDVLLPDGREEILVLGPVGAVSQERAVLQIGPLAGATRIFVVADIVPGPAVERVFADPRHIVRHEVIAKAGNARVRRGLIQLAWRFLRFQKESALAQWYRGRTEDVAGKRKRTMIVALARKLLIALWRLVTIGEIPVGVALRTAVA